MLNQAMMYWRFTRGLKKYLKEPITITQAKRVTAQRLQDRENNLLSIVKRCIFENESSPYLKLFKLAGCEYGDIERLVRSHGIESALTKLCKQGVYVSVEEYKGQKDVIRGSETIHFSSGDFDNHFSGRQVETSSSGSRGAGTRTVYDFDFLVNSFTKMKILQLDAYNLFDFPMAIWFPIMPGVGPLTLLSYAKGGVIPERWFSPVDKRQFKPELKNRMGTNYVVCAGRLFGTHLPAPEYVALDDIEKVLHWIDVTLAKTKVCTIQCYTSLAVRICQAARKKKQDISGLRLLVGGEPLTETKQKEIKAAGVIAYPVYASAEAGLIGCGCVNPVAVDDVHLNQDVLALIQHSREVPHAKTSVNAFLFTSLLSFFPKILFNVESGDYGTIETRDCGCKLGNIGFTQHIHNIRGFDKLTSEGMSFVGTDMVRMIEEVLPLKFGGASTDYQIVEEEDEAGHSRISVLVNPDIGKINETELKSVILDELGKGKDTKRMMAEMWSQANTLRVKRIRPLTTNTGKLLPMQIKKSN